MDINLRELSNNDAIAEPMAELRRIAQNLDPNECRDMYADVMVFTADLLVDILASSDRCLHCCFDTLRQGLSKFVESTQDTMMQRHMEFPEKCIDSDEGDNEIFKAGEEGGELMAAILNAISQQGNA